MNPAIPELFDLTDLASALDYTCCLLSHDNTSQWSGVKKKKKKVVADFHENQRTLFITRQEGELYSRHCKRVITIYRNRLQASSIKAHRLILLWVLNKKMFFPLLCQTTIKNYSSLPLQQENTKYWQRCCFRVSSNCSLNPFPYSWDYFQKRKRRRKTVIHSQNVFTGESNFESLTSKTYKDPDTY